MEIQQVPNHTHTATLCMVDSSIYESILWHIFLSACKNKFEMCIPPANWVWWCLMGIHPVILEFKIALKKQWSSKGCNIIPSQTKIENLRLHLHPALGFLSFRNSRPWWETPRRFPRSDGPKWLLFWMIIFLHYMIFLLHYQNHNIL